MIVVDSNVVAHLLLPGRDTTVVERLLQMDPDWMAPTLLKSEIRNILTLYMRREDLTLEKAQGLMDLMEELFQDRLYEIPSDLVFAQGHASGLSAYDAEFVVLARLLGTRLVTLDKQILREAPDLARSPIDFCRESV